MDEKKLVRYVKKIEKLSDAKEGELVLISGKIKEIAVKLSPNLTFPETYEGELYDTGMGSSIFNIGFEIRDGYLYKNSSGMKTSSEHAEDFNKIIAAFNIFGFHLDFVTNADITLFSEDSAKTPFTIPLSSKANKRGKTINKVEVKTNEKAVFFLALYVLNQGMKLDNNFELEDACKFYGYAHYYLFHNDYHLAFIYSWMFIESYINHLFNETISKINNPKYRPIKKVREWSIKRKIDELYALGAIKESTKNSLQEIRYKRNKVFHVDRDLKKRKVAFNDAWICTKMAIIIFYKMLGLEEGEILFFKELDNVRNRIGEAVYGPSFRFQPKMLNFKK